MLARTLAVLVGASLAAAGCSQGSDGSSYVPPKGPAQETVEVVAGNFFFRPTTVRLPAGINRIELVGEGGVHTLLIEGVKDLALRVDGDERTGTKVELDPGRYTFYCDVPGHRDNGMEGTIRVT